LRPEARGRESKGSSPDYYLAGSLAAARDADSDSQARRHAAGGFPVIRLNAREKAASES